MSKNKPAKTVEPADPFMSIDSKDLANVAGGAARVTARGGTDPQLTAMLTQIGDSIKSLASAKSDDGGMSQMMMMMMMMGGGGGGGGAAPAPQPAPQQLPVINITNRHGCG
jgi:hypothetical protein